MSKEKKVKLELTSSEFEKLQYIIWKQFAIKDEEQKDIQSENLWNKLIYQRYFAQL